MRLKPAGPQSRLKLPKVFWQFGSPAHSRSGPGWMFQCQDFRVQCLSWKIGGGTGAGPGAIFRMIRAVAKQRQSGVGCLDANLMFPAGFEPEPQFGDAAPAVGEWVFCE